MNSSRSRAPPLPQLAKLGGAILEGHGNREQEIDPDVCTTLHAGGRGEGLWTWKNKPLLRYSVGGLSSRHSGKNSTDTSIGEAAKVFPNVYGTCRCLLFPLLLSPYWPVGGLLQVDTHSTQFLFHSCFVPIHHASSLGTVQDSCYGK